MIRAAVMADIPTMADMLAGLHAMVERPLEFDRQHCMGRLLVAIKSPDWLAIVADSNGLSGLLVASAGPTTISPELVAVEHAWISRVPGTGRLLAAEYEAWARGKGCVAMHLSGLPGQPAPTGYVAAELSFVKAL